MLVKIKSSEEKTVGGILLPSTAQSKPQSGEVVAIGDGRSFGKNKVEINVEVNNFIFNSFYSPAVRFLSLHRQLSWLRTWACAPGVSSLRFPRILAEE